MGANSMAITIGMDWFLLDLLFDGAHLRAHSKESWPQYPEQGTFRKGWFQDVVYISCPPICRFRFYLFWFYCPPPRPPDIWVCSGASATYCPLALAFASSSWPL